MAFRRRSEEKVSPGHSLPGPAASSTPAPAPLERQTSGSLENLSALLSAAASSVDNHLQALQSGPRPPRRQPAAYDGLIHRGRTPSGRQGHAVHPVAARRAEHVPGSGPSERRIDIPEPVSAALPSPGPAEIPAPAPAGVPAPAPAVPAPAPAPAAAVPAPAAGPPPDRVPDGIEQARDDEARAQLEQFRIAFGNLSPPFLQSSFLVVSLLAMVFIMEHHETILTWIFLCVGLVNTEATLVKVRAARTMETNEVRMLLAVVLYCVFHLGFFAYRTDPTMLLHLVLYAPSWVAREAAEISGMGAVNPDLTFTGALYIVMMCDPVARFLEALCEAMLLLPLALAGTPFCAPCMIVRQWCAGADIEGVDRPLLSRRSVRRVLLLHSSVWYLYRLLLPFPVWYTFFSQRVAGGFFAGMYVFFKATTVLPAVLKVIAALRVVATCQPPFGKYVSVSELVEEGRADTNCSICFSPFRSPIRLSCSHTFCEDCIASWLEQQRTCPLCRAEVPEIESQDVDGRVSNQQWQRRGMAPVF